MIFLSDALPNRYSSVPFVVIGVILLNGVLGTAELFLTDSVLVDFMKRVVEQGGLPAAFLSIFVPANFFFFFTKALLVWAFGRRLEDACGHGRFLMFFLACGLISYFVGTAFASEFSAGTNGVAFALIGAFLLVFPRGKLSLTIWLRVPLIFLRLYISKEFILSVWWIAVPLAAVQLVSMLTMDGFFVARAVSLFVGPLLIVLFLRPDAFARMRHRVPI